MGDDCDPEQTSLIEGKLTRIEFTGDFSRSNVISAKINPSSANPSLKIHVSLNIQTNHVKQIFEKTCRDNNFRVDDQGVYGAMATESFKLNLSQLLTCCFTASAGRPLSCLKLTVHVHKRDQHRVINLRSTQGDRAKNLKFCIDFRRDLEGTIMRCDKRLVQMRDSTSASPDTIYQLHRVLSDQESIVGKQVTEFVKTLNMDQSPPDIISTIHETVKRFVEIFKTQYDLGMQNSASKYCRPVVEKFIYARVYSKLFAAYVSENQETHKAFKANWDLVKTLNSEQISETIQLPESAKDISLDTAVAQLDQIEVLSSPLEKLNSYISALSGLRTAWIDAKAKYSPDEEVRIFCSLILRSEVKNFISELNFCVDYWSILQEFEKELTMLKVAQNAVKIIIDYKKLDHD